MQKITVGEQDAGQRLDKYLQKILKEADKGFLYKMLRKKNITLNGRKAEGSEKLASGDEVCFFLSNETFEKFRGQAAVAGPLKRQVSGRLQVVFEDHHVLFADKPAGLLTQKAAAGDVSLVEYIEEYLSGQGALEGMAFSVGTANRLDRNTSGLVAAGKTLTGQQLLTAFFRERLIEKYYRCITCGRMDKPLHLKQYYRKDAASNTAELFDEPFEGAQTAELEAFPLAALSDGFTLVRVHLITGRSHQIRAQLSGAGFPVLGDGKYGDQAANRAFSERYAYPLRHQLLHAGEMLISAPGEGAAARIGLSAEAEKEWDALSGKTVSAPLPANFRRCLTLLGGEAYGR